MKIVSVTINPTIDINTSVKQVIAEYKLRCKAPVYEAGGGGLNVSRAIKKLGGNSLAIYLAGGTNGDLLQNIINEEGIKQSVIEINGMTRESITISEESSDRQYRFVMPGPAVNKNEWEQCLNKIKNLNNEPEYIVVSGSLAPGIPNDFYARITKITKEMEIRVIVDTSGDALCAAVEEGVFLIKPNMRELNDLSGEKIKDEKDIIDFSKSLLKNNKCENIVVSLGAAGAIFISKDHAEHIKSPTVPIKSKVGAGDSMTAGIALSLERGFSVIEAVKFGVAAGASAVMTPGTELCTKEDTERLYQNMNWQENEKSN